MTGLPGTNPLTGRIDAKRSAAMRMLRELLRRAPSFRRPASAGYDAFVSYAHEDVVVARFVAEYLESAWVPWRWSRRRVFLDATALRADGSLDENIRKALASSRFLLVVCSTNAVASKWVDKEVEAFCQAAPDTKDDSRRANHTRVMACDAQSQDDGVDAKVTRPKALLEVEARHGERLHLNLSAAFTLHALMAKAATIQWPRRLTLSSSILRQRAELQLCAAALLAPIVDLTPAELVSRRARWLWRLQCAAILTIVVGIVYVGARLLFERTDAFARERALRAIIATAEEDRSDEAGVYHMIAALARAGREYEAERAANMFTDAEMGSLGRAYASALGPAERCADAARQAATVTAQTARLRVEAWLSLACRCPQIDIAMASPQQPDPLDIERWAERLGQTCPERLASSPIDLGALDPWKTWLSQARSAAFLAGAATRRRGVDIPVVIDLSVACPADGEAYFFVDDTLAIVRQFDRRGALSDPNAQRVLEIADRCIQHLDLGQLRTWSAAAELAAHEAGAGLGSRAAARLAHVISAAGKRHHLPDWADGWGWIGLANLRLQPSLSDPFGDMMAILRGAGVGSRTYKELWPCAEALGLASKWVEAFALARHAGDSLSRAFVLAETVELFRLQHSDLGMAEAWSKELSRLLML